MDCLLDLPPTGMHRLSRWYRPCIYQPSIQRKSSADQCSLLDRHGTHAIAIAPIRERAWQRR